MKKMFRTKNNRNFYFIKEIQWSNKAMKINQLNPNNNNQNSIQNINSSNLLKEKAWNKRFVYNKIQNYDASKDKNIFAHFAKNDEMNCYHNAMKKNDFIIKSFYSCNKNKKKAPEEYNKTNIKISLNPMGKTLKKAKIINNSFSTNNIFKNRMLSSDLLQNKNDNKNDININSINKLLNNDPNSPDKLTKIWNDLCILQPYRELFSILITQLSDKNKSDFCEREFNELNELKNNLQLLSTSVYYRNIILENLNFLNDQLGSVLQSKQSISNEVILKKISKKIEKLREYTVNICFLMQKIKSKINQGHPWGKYNLDAIAEKYKFDKNYLIKMKEEMYVLKEGYTKYFFDVADDSNPFLLNASEPVDKKEKISDPFFHYIPLSDEMRENINQCIYIIYQELIGYQNSNVSENNFRNVSPIKKYKYTEMDIKVYKKCNENINNSINNSIFSLSNNSSFFQRNSGISPSRTIYSGIHKSANIGSKDKKFINKRILSGNDKENTDIKKYLIKIDKNSNDFEDKTTNYNNNVDIKDIILNAEKNNINNDIDILNKKNDIHNQENNKENEDEKENLNNKKSEEEKYSEFKNISNPKNIENTNTKSEKEEYDFNNINLDTNNKLIIESNINSNNINDINDENENFNYNNKLNINNNLEEIIEEEKIKTESVKNYNNNNKGNEINGSNDINTDDNNNINIEKNIENLDKLTSNKENVEENDNFKIDSLDEQKEIEKKEEKKDIEEKEEKKEIDEIFVKKEIEKENSKNNDLNFNKSNKSIPKLKSKNLKISIFDDDIGIFCNDFYEGYYSSIPQVMKNMFKIEKEIIKNILSGICPYILLIYENIFISEGEEIRDWSNIKNNILGICIFNYEYKKGSINIRINHISTNDIIKEEDNINTNIDINSLKQIKCILKVIIEYIKKNFYFDEIIIEYNGNKVNNDILNIFLDDLNFVAINDNEELEEEDNINKNGPTVNKGENIFEQNCKIVFVNDNTKNRVNDLIRKSIQKYLGKNILDIFEYVLITHSSELINLDKGKKIEGNRINNILTKFLLDKKERSNVSRLYNKLTSLDQLIKLFQNHNINNKEIPLSLAENRFDILSTVINKTSFNNHFCNTSFFSNYNINYSNSYLDKKTGIYYNFIKAEKILILENDKYKIKFCHLLNNNLSLFFCKMNDDINKYLNKNNFYTQLNNIYKEALSINKKHVYDNKIIWLPCFEIYKHLKTFSNNSSGTIHEYIKISNKKINQIKGEILKIKNSSDKDYYLMKITPDINRDFIINNDFIFGIINNAEILNKKILEKDKKEENKTGDDNDNISEEIEGDIDNKDEPYVIFLSVINKNDFIINNI